MLTVSETPQRGRRGGQQHAQRVAAAAVNSAIARSPTVMLMTDQAATPAAASRTCAAPKAPGTASAKAAASGASATTASAVANRGDSGPAQQGAEHRGHRDPGDGEQADRGAGDDPVSGGECGHHEDQADDGECGGALNVCCAPGSFTGDGEDRRGVGDVLDDPRSGWAQGNRL